MIDSHCHLDVPAFDADREAVISRATATGVIGMVVPAIRPRTWAALQALATTHHAAGVRWAVGVHPQIVPELGLDELEDLLLVETDAPDQAPEGHRGGRSEPAMLPAVIAGLASAKHIEAAEIAEVTTRNARRLFASW